MKRKVLVIAQKEFADFIWSPRFIALLATFTFITFLVGYQQGLGVSLSITGNTQVMIRAFRGVARMVGLFIPLIGISIGFDSVIRERKSGSLNVLLTHPVYRDNIIAGKLLGAVLTLLLVVIVSMTISLGTMLFVSGVKVTSIEIERIVLSMLITFFYTLIFLVLGILISIYAKDSSDAIIFGVSIWVLICLLFGSVVLTIARMITGETYLSSNQLTGIAMSLYNISPMHHYSAVVLGEIDMGYGGFNMRYDIRGVFDTGYTLYQWLSMFWTNLVIIGIMPIILLITSFIAFLRMDILIE